MKRRTMVVAALLVLAMTPAALLLAQLGGARWLAMPVKGDPGISWMVVVDTPHYRVLRDFAEPGATRRIAFSEDDHPGQPRLESFEHQHLPQHSRVVLRNAPLFVMVGAHLSVLALRPRATV